jgi:hypothetical protein
VLLTRAPLYRGRSPFSLDLHVLGAPLTFVLSQDQTLQLNLCRSALLRKGAPQLGHWRHCNSLVYSAMLWLFLLCHVDGLATSSAYAADEPGPTLLRDDSLFNPVFKDRGRSTSALTRSTSGLLSLRLAACGAYSSSGLRTLVPAIQLVKHFFFNPFPGPASGVSATGRRTLVRFAFWSRWNSRFFERAEVLRFFAGGR